MLQNVNVKRPSSLTSFIDKLMNTKNFIHNKSEGLYMVSNVSDLSRIREELSLVYLSQANNGEDLRQKITYYAEEETENYVVLYDKKDHCITYAVYCIEN